MFKAKTLLVSILIAGFAFSPALVAANSWTDRAEQGGLEAIGSQAYDQSNQPRSLQSIIAEIVKVFLGLLGIIFVVLLILAGFKYMTAGGDQDKIKEAVGQIRNAVIGLLIVAAAYSITQFITVQTIPNLINSNN